MVSIQLKCFTRNQIHLWTLLFQIWHGAHVSNLNPIVNWVFPKCFHWIRWFQPLKMFVFAVKGFEPAISCVRDQDATTTPARHIQETGFLNWPQSMLQWFIRFPEFAEFPFHSGKTPMRRLYFWWLFCSKILGGRRDLQIVVLLKTKYSFSGADNVR